MTRKKNGRESMKIESKIKQTGWIIFARWNVSNQHIDVPKIPCIFQLCDFTYFFRTTLCPFWCSVYVNATLSHHRRQYDKISKRQQPQQLIVLLHFEW